MNTGIIGAPEIIIIVIVLLVIAGVFFASRRLFGKKAASELELSSDVSFTSKYTPIAKTIKPEPQPVVQVSSGFGKVRVFISYRRNPTWGQARAIANDLEARGAEVFFDVDSINEGHFANVIAEAIRRCDYFVLILAPDTLQSEWVQREVLAAQEHNKMIIPVLVNGTMLDASKLPENMRFVASFNAIQLIPEYYNEGIDRLASRFLKIS